MNNSSNQMAKKASKGAFWNVIGGVGQAVIRLTASLFLARTLDPIDFGIMGMGIIVMTFLAHLGSLGIGSGIIARRNPSQEDLSTAFWLMLGTRIVLFTLALLSAPAVAWFFQKPEVADAFRVISFSFLISALSSVSVPLLNLNFRYRAISLIRMSGIFIESTIAVCLAVNTDMGYWALIIAMIVASLFIEVSLFAAAGWFPSFVFSNQSLEFFKKYIINGFGSSLSVYMINNIDYLIIGRILGATQLGLYEFAYRIPHLIQDRIAAPIGSVMLPVFSLVRGQDDKGRVFTGYTKATRLIAFCTYPVLFCFSALADQAVPLLWGEKWLDIIPLIRILTIAAAIACTTVTLGPIFHSHERPDLSFKMNFSRLLFTTGAIIAFGIPFGLKGVASGIVVGWLPNFYFMAQGIYLIHGQMRKVCRELLIISLGTLLGFLASWQVSVLIFSQINSLFLAVLIGGISYLAVYLTFFGTCYRRIIGELYETVCKISG